MPPANLFRRARVGLVLGAGGTAGLAFHAGTLLALSTDLGWDAREADIVVGSSAGAVAGSLLRAGFDADDLGAWSASVSPRAGAEVRRAALDEMEATGLRWRSPSLASAMPDPRSLARAAIRGFRPTTAALALLPQGVLDHRASMAGLERLLPSWPEEPLWIAAVRRSDGRRVVFGRDQQADITQAVAASCAIPGLFRPVRIGDHDFVDGAAHSPTNADLLVGASVDLAIILSPMSRQGGNLPRSPADLARLALARQLAHERRQLERAGIKVAVFAPDEATVNAIGVNALDRRRTPRVLTAAYFAAGAQISASEDLAVLRRSRLAA
jgi:NTE family protein